MNLEGGRAYEMEHPARESLNCELRWWRQILADQQV